MAQPKILAWRAYARPLARFKGATSRRRGGEWGKGKEGRGTEREKRGRTEGKGRRGKLEQGRRLAKAGPEPIGGAAPRKFYTR